MATPKVNSWRILAGEFGFQERSQEGGPDYQKTPEDSIAGPCLVLIFNPRLAKVYFAAAATDLKHLLMDVKPTIYGLYTHANDTQRPWLKTSCLGLSSPCFISAELSAKAPDSRQ